MHEGVLCPGDELDEGGRLAQTRADEVLVHLHHVAGVRHDAETSPRRVLCDLQPLAPAAMSRREAFCKRACPSRSSACNGSSIQSISTSSSTGKSRMAVAKSQRWFASHIKPMSSPIARRTARTLCTSSRQSDFPTLIFTRRHPLSTNDTRSRTTSSPVRFSQPPSVL